MSIIERNAAESIQIQLKLYKRPRGGDGKLKHVKSKTITLRGVSFEDAEQRLRREFRDKTHQ